MFTGALAGIVAAQSASLTALSVRTSLLSMRRSSMQVEQASAITHYFQTTTGDVDMRNVIKQKCIVTPFSRTNRSMSSDNDVGLPNTSEHDRDVNTLLAEGWNPLGPTMAIPCGNKVALVQTMVKYADTNINEST